MNRLASLMFIFAVPVTVNLYTGMVKADDIQIKFSGRLIDAPPCVVNDGQKIVVDFGDDVITTRIDGTNYKQLVTFPLDCSEAISMKQRVRISGTTTDFDADALSTDLTGLGIAFYNGSKRYLMGEWIPFTAPDIPELQAVLVKQDSVILAGGTFTTLASLVVDYQ